MNGLVFYLILPLMFTFLLDDSLLNSINGWIIISIIVVATLINMIVLIVIMVK